MAFGGRSRTPPGTFAAGPLQRYVLAVLLGSGEIAPRVRAHCEVLRSQPRHGTKRRLSALSIGILALSLARFADLVRAELGRILAALQRGLSTTEISP